jgi:hypothetical protein
MKFKFRNIPLLILGSIFTSCNGQVKNENLSVEKVSEVIKISLPKNGFSNGYAAQAQRSKSTQDSTASMFTDVTHSKWNPHAIKSHLFPPYPGTHLHLLQQTS